MKDNFERQTRGKFRRCAYDDANQHRSAYTAKLLPGEPKNGTHKIFTLQNRNGLRTFHPMQFQRLHVKIS